MAKFSDQVVDFMQHRGVILGSYVLFSAAKTALLWLDPAQPEDARMGAAMGLLVYAVVALYAWRRNTLAIWVMTACLLFTGLSSLFNSLVLSLTNPLETMGMNALNLILGAYFTISGVVIFRTRRIKIVSIQAVAEEPESEAKPSSPLAPPASPVTRKAEEGSASSVSGKAEEGPAEKKEE
ncbi:hypothetical protein [Desulfovibrio aminophilus]|uniref:hypothetical protein n=1 Tax=Desulfovibrio aminophilus TaxID=81425 RepID=UPI003394A95C